MHLCEGQFVRLNRNVLRSFFTARSFREVEIVVKIFETELRTKKCFSFLHSHQIKKKLKTATQNDVLLHVIEVFKNKLARNLTREFNVKTSFYKGLFSDKQSLMKLSNIFSVLTANTKNYTLR